MKIVAKKVPKEWPRAGCGRQCKFTTYKSGLQEILLHIPMAAPAHPGSHDASVARSAFAGTRNFHGAN
ncbi:hypothetical protein GTP56_13010 [Duganella sp. FT134W]|uniref:Uncharacterized protein n=1 Tax=Duganella margarita TaxID=2692170 RepID=A0A7X4H2L1_9BURK|nr:hypothetical protein [Duganella margarita]MYM73109.1 hypothetical protein [Duganella margarita]